MVGIQSNSHDSVMKTGFIRAGIPHLVSMHDAEFCIFCFDKTWTHPSRVQQARFLQLGLSHSWWCNGAVATLMDCACPCQPWQDKGPSRHHWLWGRGADPSTLPGHPVQPHTEEQQQTERLWLCVSTDRGFARKQALEICTASELMLS